MDTELILICTLTGVINLIGALAYAARIAGVRTGRIALSFALFNVLLLVSRTSNGFLGPFLAKRIETALASGGGDALIWDLRLVLFAAAASVLLGIVLVPTGQRLFARGITYFQRNRSTAKLLLRTATPSGLRTVRESVAIPTRETLRSLSKPRGVSWSVLAANCLAQGLLAVGVLASLYAGYLNPEFRVTASQMSAIVNGVATILLFALIDPQISALTDDVVDGSVSEPTFRRAMIWVSLSRLVGTLLAQALLVPAAVLIAYAAAVL
ncbi:MAG TPA: lipid II flippase Amj family protein [Erythrobacter sp.]|nr:lipid II flippase Amj family protein [Erythrobacter sp.]